MTNKVSDIPAWHQLLCPSTPRRPMLLVDSMVVFSFKKVCAKQHTNLGLHHNHGGLADSVAFHFWFWVHGKSVFCEFINRSFKTFAGFLLQAARVMLTKM